MKERRRRYPARPSARPATRTWCSLRNRKVQHRRTRRPAVRHTRLRTRRSRRHRPHTHRRRTSRRPGSPDSSIHSQRRPLRRRNIRLRSQRSRHRQITPSIEDHNIVRQISRLRYPSTAVPNPHSSRSPRRPLRPSSSRRPRNPSLRQHRPKRRTHIRLSSHIRCDRHVT